MCKPIVEAATQVRSLLLFFAFSAALLSVSASAQTIFGNGSAGDPKQLPEHAMLDTPTRSRHPATVMLPPGKYSVRVQRAGFQEYEESVELTADSLKQLSVSLVEARRGMGLVEVRTVPPGADIIVDSTNTGRRTPFTLELAAGEHTITLYLRGYQAVNKKVVVGADKTVSLNEILPR